MIIDTSITIRSWSERPNARWVLAGIHLLFLFGLFHYQGILTDGEATKYLGCAKRVLHGDFNDLTGNYLRFATYILFLVPFIELGASVIVLLQIAIGLFAAFALYRFVERLSGSPSAALLGMGLYLLCYPIQAWTLSMYTEALFTPLSILFLERIDRSRKPDALVLLLGFLLIFTRPVGMLFVLPALLFAITAERDHQRVLRVLGSIGILLFAIGLPGIRPAQLEPIVHAQVIAGVPSEFAVDAPFIGSSILAAQMHLAQQLSLGDWASLTGQRIRSLFSLTRPYYSAGHNSIVALWYILYPLAILGVWISRRNPQSAVILVIVLIYTTLIGLTHDEWSGRFLVPVLPWIIAFAAVGMASLPIFGKPTKSHP